MDTVMTPDDLEEMAKILISRGYAEDTAWDYAVRIGDTPAPDKNGKWIILNDAGEEIDRIDPLY